MTLTLLLLLALSVAAILHLWLRADLLASYAALFAPKKHEQWRAFIARPKISGACCEAEERKLSFLAWIASEWSRRGRFGKWIAKLMTCPHCLGFWLSLAASSAAGFPLWSLAVYYAALTLFFRAA